MIRYLRNQEIDKVKWNECIDNSINSLVYGYSWYLDIVCPDWSCLVENDYISVFPLTAGKKWEINYLYQPYFTQQLGIFSKNNITDSVLEDFIGNIPKKYKFIEICLNSQNIFSHKISNFVYRPNINLELDLHCSYKDIFENYSTNAHRNLNKSSKNSLTIRKGIEMDLIIDMFRNNRGKEIVKLKSQHYQTLKELVQACKERGRGITYGAYTSENKLCAGIVILESGSRKPEAGKKYIFLFSGSDEDARSNGAMFLLIDNHIKEIAGEDAIFDFEGSNDENLANFYRGFGAKEKLYYFIKKNSLPLPIRKAVSFVKLLKKQ